MKTKTLRQLHTWLGLGSALFFLLLGITGVLLTFRGTFRTPPVVVPETVQLEPPVDVWEIIQRAESDIGAKASSVSFSDTPKKAHTHPDARRASQYPLLFPKRCSLRDSRPFRAVIQWLDV